MKHTNEFNNTVRTISERQTNTFNFLGINGAKLLLNAIDNYNLQPKKLNKGKLIKFFFNNQEVSYMKGMRPGSTTDAAFNLCKDKYKLEQHLKKLNLKTLDSKLFTKVQYDDAFNYIKNNVETKFVVKPLNLRAGKGILFNVDTENFDNAWNKCIESQLSEGYTKPSCIVQPHINGFDLRVTIIEGKYSGAVLRLPAHVVGDGKSTIRELIEDKNEKRQLITYFKSKLIPTDKRTETFLNNQQLNFDSIPTEDQVVMLTHISNLTFGGESIDVTDVLSERIKELAIHSVASVPGLFTAGVDILTEDYLNGEGFVIEINTNSNLTMHHMPYKGEARYPYDDFVRINLIRHKLEHNIEISNDDRDFYKEVEEFLALKKDYSQKQLDSKSSVIKLNRFNTKLLEDVLLHVNKEDRNEYGLNITLDLYEVLKQELNVIGVKYEPFVYKGRNRLKIFDGDHEVKTYQKNVYQNNSEFGFKISNDKFLTEKYLKLANIPTSNSILLRESEIDIAHRHIEAGNKRYVVKPIALMNGIGVFTDVNLDNLNEVWDECFTIQKRRKVKAPRVLVQDYIEGYEVRVIVTEGKALSATIRTPAYVIGDGQKTIQDLINNKNEKRKQNGFFANKLIKLNDQLTDFLASQGLSMDTVLESERLVVLNPVSNLVNGGENIVITDFVKKEILELAEAGVAAMPGIQTAGVDILLNDLNDTEAVILEINKAPAFQLNYYPYIGEPQYPLQYIFKSLILEDRILSGRLKFDEITREDHQLMIERYKALYEKQKSLEKIIKNLSV
ncbi:MAG TPA: ATP-grasp domain-containing protein [Aliicoccus persicus]|uniref:ATP-grasp domain-containing protein n=1 Tax=Aliicoccus persicus TaxID=930138 RepID=A0A921DXI0_9STAP|nr:ATP-grasp domain-containing protein [Aliicoccus persicus]